MGRTHGGRFKGDALTANNDESEGHEDMRVMGIWFAVGCARVGWNGDTIGRCFTRDNRNICIDLRHPMAATE